jgi:hypothetical protein
MKSSAFLAIAFASLSPAFTWGQTPTARPSPVCAVDGNIQLVCDQHRPEDLMQVPDTDWIIVSSIDGGGIGAVNARDKSTTVLYPSPTAKHHFDKATYNGCPGPPDSEEWSHLSTVGLALRRGPGGVHTLYAVALGNRAGIEVFNLDARGKQPSLTWIGCVTAPATAFLNAVVPLSDGGLISTNWTERGANAEASRAKMMVGEINGDVLEWHAGKGWSEVPGSETSGANGVEVSKDGKWIYVDAWGSKSFYRLSRGANPPKREEVPVGFRIDNVHWAPDGSLIAAGQTDNSTRVVKIDPETLKVTLLLDKPDSPVFAHASGAIQIGNEIWVTSPRGERIAVFPAPK